MSDFKAKIHQMRPASVLSMMMMMKFDLRCGCRPPEDPAKGTYSTALDLLAVFKGSLLRGARGKDDGREWKGRERRR